MSIINRQRARLVTTTAIVALLAAAPLAAFAPAAQAAPAPESFAPLVAQVKDAVVNVSTTQVQPGSDQQAMPQMPELPPGFQQFFQQFGQGGMSGMQQARPERHRQVKALGSGFIVDPSGYIVTNNHVVQNGTDIKVTLSDGTTLDAKVIGTDPKTDLAVLKVDAGHPLPSVQFGDSDKAKVGDWVLAVGNPFGLGGTVTAGIVSARGRDIGEGPYDQFLQVDAAINQGNSGGPTFNSQGQVIGVNTAILSPNGGGSVGIGFAIPSDVATRVVAQLEKTGTVARGFLGVNVQPITPDMEQALGLKATKGALVADVTADSPAQKAEIKSGDVITGFNGHPVDAVRDLTNAVADTAAGTHATVDLLRDGKAITVSADVGRMPTDKQTAANDSHADQSQPRLGLQLAPLNQEARQRFDIASSTNGAVIVGIVPGSSADQSGLAVGDVVERVGATVVHSPNDVANAVRDAAKDGRKQVALLVHHDGQDGYIAVPLAAS